MGSLGKALNPLTHLKATKKLIQKTDPVMGKLMGGGGNKQKAMVQALQASGDQPNIAGDPSMAPPPELGMRQRIQGYMKNNPGADAQLAGIIGGGGGDFGTAMSQNAAMPGAMPMMGAGGGGSQQQALDPAMAQESTGPAQMWGQAAQPTGAGPMMGPGQTMQQPPALPPQQPAVRGRMAQALRKMQNYGAQ